MCSSPYNDDISRQVNLSMDISYSALVLHFVLKLIQKSQYLICSEDKLLTDIAVIVYIISIFVLIIHCQLCTLIMSLNKGSNDVKTLKEFHSSNTPYIVQKCPSKKMLRPVLANQAVEVLFVTIKSVYSRNQILRQKRRMLIS